MAGDGTVLYHARSVAYIVGRGGRWMGLDRLPQQSHDAMDRLDAAETDGHHWTRYIHTK